MKAQVLLAFVISASATLVIAWVSYVVQPVDGALGNLVNILDKKFLEWIWTWTTRAPTMSSRWNRVLHKVILHLSDSHIVAGLAIMIAGFLQLCQISVYHFHFVVFLAWMASSTHMTTLTILRTYLRRHRPVLKWRVIAMTAMFIMLFVALASTASQVWPGSDGVSFEEPSRRYVYGILFYDSPVRCAWRKDYMRVWEPDTVFSLCLLTAGYLAKLSKLFITTSDFFRLWLRDRPSLWLKRIFDAAETRAATSSNPSSSFFWKSLATLVLGIYVDARALYDLYDSLLSELIWLSFNLLWGISKIFAWRMQSVVREYEDRWGFGQLLSLFLLFLPLLAVPGFYAGEIQSDTSDAC